MARNLRKNRSEGYQYLLLEIQCSNERLTEYSDSQGLVCKTNYDDIICEELANLKERLKQAQWRIIDSQLTDRQREVIRMSAAGMTQTEIAKKLQVNQSSITKSINGNTDYRGKNKKVYGGAKKKLKRIADADPEILEIIARIQELENY